MFRACFRTANGARIFQPWHPCARVAHNRHGEVGIFIGSLTDQNRGYGRDALLTLLRFGFDRLGLHSIAIKANAENERAVHLYSSIGFVETGRERDVVFMRGRFRDHTCFDMLESEFHERYGLSE